MASNPKRQRVLAALARRAIAEFGDEASGTEASLEYVCAFVANAGIMQKFADSFAEELGESVSRNFMSGIVNNLTADARERIAAAREEGAHAMVDKSLIIAGGIPETPLGVQKAKLEISTLQWAAERFNRNAFGTKPVELTISFGQMHLDSLRLPPPPAPVAVVAGTARLITGSSELTDDVPE